MSSYATRGMGLIIGLTIAFSSEARQQPYIGQPGESPQLIRCKQEAQYIGVGGKGYDTHAESNRLLRRDHIKKCMQRQ